MLKGETEMNLFGKKFALVPALIAVFAMAGSAQAENLVIGDNYNVTDGILIGTYESEVGIFGGNNTNDVELTDAIVTTSGDVTLNGGRFYGGGDGCGVRGTSKLTINMPNASGKVSSVAGSSNPGTMRTVSDGSVELNILNIGNADIGLVSGVCLDESTSCTYSVGDINMTVDNPTDTKLGNIRGISENAWGSNQGNVTITADNINISVKNGNINDLRTVYANLPNDSITIGDITVELSGGTDANGSGAGIITGISIAAPMRKAEFGNAKVIITGGEWKNNIWLGGQVLYGSSSQDEIIANGNLECVVIGDAGAKAMNDNGISLGAILNADSHIFTHKGERASITFSDITDASLLGNASHRGASRNLNSGERIKLDTNPTIVFDNVQGVFNCEVTHMDTLEIAPGTELTIASETFEIEKQIVFTGDWSEQNIENTLTVTTPAVAEKLKALKVDYTTNATGLEEVSWTDDGKLAVKATPENPEPTPDPDPTPEPKPESSSSGGGCSAGFGALVLLAAVPLMFRRKK